ncbi:MAG: RDD family protein [Myxococcota bacterium]
MRAERHHPHTAFAVGRARNHDREYRPAPLGRRLAAAALDCANIASVSAAILVCHLYLVGALFPLWVIAAVVVAWVVLPLWASGRTLGLKAFGLRMIRGDGKPMDLLELAFRELIARGTVSAAILFIAALVPAIEAQGAQELPTPSGLWSVVLVIAISNVVLALVGHTLAAFRADRRTGQDLMSRVWVVDFDAHERSTLRLLGREPEPAREPADQWRQRENRRMVSTFLACELACVAFGVGVPLLSRVEVSAFDVQERFEEQRAARRMNALRDAFDRSPTDRWVVEEYERALADGGRVVEAQWVRNRYEEAVKVEEEREERTLRKQLAQTPSWAALDRLVGLLSRKGRVSEARDVYQAYVEVEIDPYGFQAFGIWLYRNRFDAQAIKLLERAIDAGADDAISHAYLGLTLERLGHGREARAAYRRALRHDNQIGESLGLKLPNARSRHSKANRRRAISE